MASMASNIYQKVAKVAEEVLRKWLSISGYKYSIVLESLLPPPDSLNFKPVLLQLSREYSFYPASCFIFLVRIFRKAVRRRCYPHLRPLQQRRQAGHRLLWRRTSPEILRERLERFQGVQPPHHHGHFAHCPAFRQPRRQVV